MNGIESGSSWKQRFIIKNTLSYWLVPLDAFIRMGSRGFF
nr:MAG TPA: hypothetical protein [Bacteriophage sp.]